jgi:hypothetical protein
VAVVSAFHEKVPVRQPESRRENDPKTCCATENAPLTVEPSTLAVNRCCSLIGKGPVSVTDVKTHVFPGAFVSRTSVTDSPFVDTVSTTHPPPEWVPVYVAPGMCVAEAPVT